MTLLFERLPSAMNNAQAAGTENPSAAENGEVKSAAPSEKFVSATTRCSSSLREAAAIDVWLFQRDGPGSR